MPVLLASGFGPFPDYPDNASWDALANVQPRLPADWTLQRVRLDVAWSRAGERLLGSIGDDTRVVIAFGQADDDPVRIERFALNAPDTSLPDVDDLRLTTSHIIPGGPAAYETGLPANDLLEAINAIEPATTAATANPTQCCVESHFAGGYLCNFTFYQLMHQVATVRPDISAGFIHVPPAQRRPLAATTRAMEVAMEVAVEVATERARDVDSARAPAGGAEG